MHLRGHPHLRARSENSGLPRRQDEGLTIHRYIALTFSVINQTLRKFGRFELLLASASFTIILQDVSTFIKDVYISFDETVCGSRYLSNDKAPMSS